MTNIGYPIDLYHQFSSTYNIKDIIQDFGFYYLIDKNIEEFVIKDTYPIPKKKHRENYYGDLDFCYWLSGLNDFFGLKSLSSKYNFSLSNIMDYGGASGRIARHFLSSNYNENIFLSDINKNHIEYVNTHLNKDKLVIKTIEIDQSGSLPVESNFFNFIYSYSVFTHIDDNEIFLLKELNRVLASGGYALITIHSEHTWNMLPNIFLYEALKNDKSYLELINNKNSLEIFESKQKLVFKYNNEPNYNCNTFHHSNYILAEWSKIFEIVEIIPEFHSYQTGILLYKKY